MVFGTGYVDIFLTRAFFHPHSAPARTTTKRLIQMVRHLNRTASRRCSNRFPWGPIDSIIATQIAGIVKNDIPEVIVIFVQIDFARTYQAVDQFGVMNYL
jgi:hypothetical protein